MTWQAVTVIALALVTLWVIMICAVVARKLEVQRAEQDVRKHISDNQLKTAQIPRSLFGSNLPTTAAAMHHSGGIGRAQIKASE